MTDLQILALSLPVALVVLVAATVFIEELFNQAAMKREKAAAKMSAPVPLGYSGRMTIEVGQGDLKKVLDDIDIAKRRAS